MKLLAAILAIAATVTAQIELVTLDGTQWSVVSHMLEQPVVTQTQGFFQITNPSFSRGSYVTVKSQAFAVVAKVGDEPDARLRVTYDATSNLPNIETLWFSVHDAQAGAQLAIRQLGVTTQRASILSPVPQGGGPVPPTTAAHCLFVIRLNPRQSWTCTGLAARRTYGPSVRYAVGVDQVSAKLERSNYGGNLLGAVWSPTTLPAPLPIAGFAGCGLLVDASVGVFFAYPLTPIVSSDPAVIALIRSGSWQPVETTPLPALGWPIGG